LNFFDISLKLNGFPIKRARLFIEDIKKQNDSEFEHYLFNAKKEIIAYHLKNNPFYKTFAKGANLDDWNSIPVMTKKHLQQPLENRLSVNFNKRNAHIHKTSGSSGDPFIFAKDKFCHALTWAIFSDRYQWYNLDINRSKQARFYGIPLDKKGYYKERLKDSLSNRFRFSVFNLSDNQFEKNLHKFKTSKFDYINGYTSSIVQFAKFLKRKNIVLNTICPTLKACVVTSEMLFKEDKDLLQRQLGIPVINEYGAAELGLIAFQNKQNKWIVNSEDLYVEILDENDTVLPNGKEGRIVITSLFNKAHPFIRYDLGDLGILSKESTNKTPILEKLVGRTNDIVVLPSGKKAAGLTFYYVTKTVIENSGNVKEFIIEQRNIDTFKIIYTSIHDIDKDLKQSILDTITLYLEPNLNIIFERKDTLDRSKRGKLKQFKSFLE
jgi:phenylacetate-CoA ligase